MGLHKDAVAADRDSGATDGLNHFGVATRHTCRLVGTLERVGDVHHHRHMVLPHNGHPTKVDH